MIRGVPNTQTGLMRDMHSVVRHTVHGTNVLCTRLVDFVAHLHRTKSPGTDTFVSKVAPYTQGNLPNTRGRIVAKPRDQPNKRSKAALDKEWE